LWQSRQFGKNITLNRFLLGTIITKGECEGKTKNQVKQKFKIKLFQ